MSHYKNDTFGHGIPNPIRLLITFIKINILGVVKRNPLFLHEILNGKIMDFFLLHLIKSLWSKI